MKYIQTNMFVLLNLIFIISCASTARILGYLPTPSYSHQVAYHPLWRELSLRGHSVTTFTMHPINDPRLTNLTEIDVSRAYQENITLLVMNMVPMNPLSNFRSYFEIMDGVLDAHLEYGPVKDLINDKGLKFDLVIVEYFFSAALALAKRFDCPSIGVLSLDAWNGWYKMIGSPTHSILYPEYITSLSDRLSLLERVESFITSVIGEYYLIDYLKNIDDKLIQKHFGSNYPSSRELASNISLLFVNADPIFHTVRPLVPAVIQIGAGTHITSPKPLPQELAMILDKASNGFIYFSLGSNFKSEFFPSATLETFISTFAQLPYTVLWKQNPDMFPNVPDNVILSKWFPQQAILKHPNIKLFITQGGLQSLEEGIYAHVPIIGLPILYDQLHNVNKMVRRGCGLSLDYRDIEEGHLKRTILEVINNPKYRNTIKTLADLARDQPISGIEKAVWWTEYVIRHKGASHLRSPLLDMPWYQYLLLDIIGPIAFSVLVVVYLLVKLVRTICPTRFNVKQKSH